MHASHIHSFNRSIHPPFFRLRTHAMEEIILLLQLPLVLLLPPPAAPALSGLSESRDKCVGQCVGWLRCYWMLDTRPHHHRLSKPTPSHPIPPRSTHSTIDRAPDTNNRASNRSREHLCGWLSSRRRVFEIDSKPHASNNPPSQPSHHTSLLPRCGSLRRRRREPTTRARGAATSIELGPSPILLLGIESMRRLTQCPCHTLIDAFTNENRGWSGIDRDPLESVV